MILITVVGRLPWSSNERLSDGGQRDVHCEGSRVQWNRQWREASGLTGTEAGFDLNGRRCTASGFTGLVGRRASIVDWKVYRSKATLGGFLKRLIVVWNGPWLHISPDFFDLEIDDHRMLQRSLARHPNLAR